MNYKETVAHYLQTLVDIGMTHQQIALALGLRKGNVVTMHLDSTNDISPFPTRRLPALAQLCGLGPVESLKLVNLRAVHHPSNATQLDRPTLHWILRSTKEALEGYGRRRSASGVATSIGEAIHGC